MLTDRLRGWIAALLRPSGTLAPLSWRGQIFDVLVAAVLVIAAAESGGGDTNQPMHIESGEERADRFERARLPDVPPAPPATPFLPIEPDQTGWELVFLLVVAPLLARRRFPLLALWAVLVSAPLVTDYNAALRLSFYACVIAAYSAAVYSPYRIPALASLPIAALLYSRLQSAAVPTVPENAVPFLILIPLAVVALGLRRWRQRADAEGARLSRLQRDQAEALRRATELERARIARELHDVVTHNVSVMVIQAGAARKVMDASPERARQALLAVESGGRAAMAELRHVMGLLTMDSDGPDPAGTSGLAPQPSLDRLEALVDRLRETGMRVSLTTAGPVRPLPPGVDLTAYRVVQEALTNSVRHAGGATAAVLVEYASDRLTVDIADTGGVVVAPAAGAGSGRGLIGLRERLAVYGGTLHTGPRPSGGYRVTATIPLDPMETTP